MIEKPDALEVLTVAYKHLWREFYDTIRDALQKMGVKGLVPEFDYPLTAKKDFVYPDGSVSEG